MNIHYDGYIYALQRAGGINRYFKNLIDRLPVDITAAMTLPVRHEHCFPNNPRLRCHFPPRNVLKSGMITSLIKPWYLAGLEKVGRTDLSHPTYHELFSGKPFASHRSPLVLTIHDMIFERFSTRTDPVGREATLKKAAVEAADAIICVSQNTKQDLMEMLGVPEERISVIPLATELSSEMACQKMRTPTAPYVIFVGSRPFYKNFARVLMALTKVTETWPDLRLVVVGRSFNPTEQEWVAALGLDDQIMQISEVSDAQLAALYRDAEALIYPSLYEGFGIPPLEAMACGTVVIAARSSSIPEVVGDAAILFDPYSADELAEHILSLRQLGIRREDSIQRGRQQAARYSWDVTAAKTVEVYRQLAR